MLLIFRTILIVLLILFGIPFSLEGPNSQANLNFDISLSVDFSAAELLLDYFDRQIGNTERVTNLRGNQLAAATSLMLARTSRHNDYFRKQLELVRDNVQIDNDIYGLLPARNQITKIRKLLIEVKRRQLDRRVIATIASYFPEQAKIAATIPVYIIAMGNDRAAAVVRRVVWKENVPMFVGEGKGEPVIMLNLARTIEMAPTVELQFVEMLSTLAHECFHAVYSILQQSLPDSTNPATVTDQLMDIVQNEGIAYYLSKQIHLGGETPSKKWFDATSKAIETLNKTLIELQSPKLTRIRAHDLLMNANLSGSFEGNYGSTAGMRMAYEIDNRLGRSALTTTLLNGGRSFILAYVQLCAHESNVPQFDEQVLQLMEQAGYLKLKR